MKIESHKHPVPVLAGALALFATLVSGAFATDDEPKEAQSAEQTKQSSEKRAVDSELPPAPGGGAPVEPSTSAPHNPNAPDAPVDGSHRDTGR